MAGGECHIRQTSFFPPGYRARERGVCRGRGFPNLRYDGLGRFSRYNPPLAEIELVRTVRHPIRVPKIILLSIFDKMPKKELKLTRKNVFERDKHRCQYCDKKLPPEDLNLDHVIPRHYEGKTTWENIVCSCIKCNSRKANRLPHEAGMRLIRKPSKPQWRPVISIAARGKKHKEWRHFIDVVLERIGKLEAIPLNGIQDRFGTDSSCLRLAARFAGWSPVHWIR